MSETKNEDEKKAWRDDYYKGREDSLLVPHIIERLVSLGYIVERVSVKHQTGGYGSTRGIGDLLVWRETWMRWTCLRGMKINLEVKTSDRAYRSAEQQASELLGGLLFVTSPDEAEILVAEVEKQLFLAYHAPPEAKKSRGSLGLSRFLGNKPTAKRRQKWLTEARAAARETAQAEKDT